MTVHELQTIIEPAVTALGYELVGCEWGSSGKSPLLRIYVDHENGVTLDECARISRQISAVLDVADSIQGPYSLEVSSPGIERPLFTLEQCRRYIGKQISLRLRVAKQGQRRFSGYLQKVESDRISLQLDDDTLLEIAWQDVEKARLVAKF